MHNMPHTEATKAKMRAARARQTKKWQTLPACDLVDRLLHTSATLLSLAEEYQCNASTIQFVYKMHTTQEQRETARQCKSSETKRGRPNPIFAKWRKNNTVWVGRKHTEESKRKQSVAKQGKKLALKHRIAQSARLQGIPVEEWKAFASSEADRLKASHEWREWREAVFTRDNWTCQQCGVRGGKLHPHHLKPKITHRELIFDVNNGVTLCVECHKKTDSYGLNAS